MASSLTTPNLGPEVSAPVSDGATDGTIDGATTIYLRQRSEQVFYNSATAERSILGRCHHALSCPGWTKATSKRFVYSRWETTPCCKSCFGGVTLPTGRALDTFDSEIVVDMSAHQTCLQICRGEGDISVFRLEGGDLSDNDEVFHITSVPNVYNVFSELTFELAKLNLRDAAAVGLGTRMGAVVWDHDARSGAEGPASKEIKEELVFYDSVTATRTIIGGFCHLDCCLPPVYKITSERVLYVEWDEWHPCDNPLQSCLCLPAYVAKALVNDCCCGFTSSNGEKANEAMKRRQENREKQKTRNCINRNVMCPTGRTANYFGE